MTIRISQFPDRTELVYQYAPQLYRLALLLAGNPHHATKLVEYAYATLPAAAPATEAALIQRLLLRRGSMRRWRMRATRAEADRAGIDHIRADALLKLLSQRAPAARLVIGLHYLRGFNVTEIAALLGAGPTDPAAVLAQFQCDAAVALRYAPADADATTLAQLDQWLDGTLSEEAVLAVRQRTFEDASVRQLRDALLAMRELLPRAVPGLFAEPMPPDLVERLLARISQPTVSDRPRFTRGRLGLTVAVLALVLAMIFGPSLLHRSSASGQAILTPAEIVDATIHRFDRAPLQTGILHERYRTENNGTTQIMERWYDYAAPHQIAFTLRQADDTSAPLVSISSDGTSVIQYRYGAAMHANHAAINVQVTPEEAQTALPMLRSFSATRLFLAQRDATDVAPLYLGQARANNVQSLGQTMLLGRSAYLLGYDQQPASTSTQSSAQYGRVLLTIDTQTYALLDVAVIPVGGAESTATHPLRADAFEVLDTAPATLFTQPSDTQTATRTGLTSVYLPELHDTNRVLTLSDAAQKTGDALLVPQQLPDDQMRGFVLNGRRNDGAVLIYEGEFQSALLVPAQQWGGNATAISGERTAGAFRYQLVHGFGDAHFALSAQVYRPEAPNQRLLAVLLDAYATDAEREAHLEQVIASLTTVTPQNIISLQHQFYPASGG